MNAKERLLEFLQYLNIGQTVFENKVGWSRGYISKIKESIGSDMIAKLVDDFPELNIEWLISGKGEMLKSQIGIGNIKNSRGNISGNVATSGGQVINIPNFTGQKIIEPDGKIELHGDAQSEIENLEIEKKYLLQRVADLENMLCMKDEIILSLKKDLKVQ